MAGSETADVKALRVTSELSELVEEFCSRSDISPKTRAFYAKLHTLLIPFANERGILHAEELTPDVIDELARELESHRKADGRPLAPASRAAYLRAVKQFLGWLQKRKAVADIDSTLVPMPRLRRKHRDVLSRSEIRQLQDAARIPRDGLIIGLLGETGCRLGEVAGVRVEDLRPVGRQGVLLVRGKTGERMVGVSPRLFQRLREYADGALGRPRTASPFLFLSHRRRPGARDYQPLTESGIYQLVKDAASRAKVSKRIHPHLLRHSAATYFLAEASPPLNPIEVSRLLGMSLSVIESNYYHQTAEQLAAAQMRALGNWTG